MDIKHQTQGIKLGQNCQIKFCFFQLMEGNPSSSWQYFQRLEAFHLLAVGYNCYVATVSALFYSECSIFKTGMNMSVMLTNLFLLFQFTWLQYTGLQFSIHDCKEFGLSARIPQWVSRCTLCVILILRYAYADTLVWL